MKHILLIRWMILVAVFLRRKWFAVVNRICHQRRLYRCKYVHLMFNDKFNKPFVDFLNRHFNPEEHLVLCKRLRHFKHPFPEGPNVIEVKTFRGLNLGRGNIQKLIFHSLFDSEMVDVLYAHPIWLDKSCWMVWGGDLYGAPRNKKYDQVLSGFRWYASGADRGIIRERYNPNAHVVSLPYIFPIDKKQLDRVIDKRRDKSKGERPLIQINNSCDGSTLPMMEALSKYVGQIRVRTIVSYGELSCRDEIVRRGLELFGRDFDAVEKFVPSVKFAEMIDEISALILNQPRQQGFGNTLAAMYLGKKVYIRGDVTTYTYLREMCVPVFNTQNIRDMGVDQLVCLNDADRKEAQMFAQSQLDECKVAELYARTFAEERSGKR